MWVNPLAGSRSLGAVGCEPWLGFQRRSPLTLRGHLAVQPGASGPELPPLQCQKL